MSRGHLLPLLHHISCSCHGLVLWSVCGMFGLTALCVPPLGWSQQHLAVGDLTLAWNFTCNLASNITKLLSTQQVAGLEHSSSSQAAALSPVSDCDFFKRARDSALKRVCNSLIILDFLLLHLATSLKCHRKKGSLFFFWGTTAIISAVGWRSLTNLHPLSAYPAPSASAPICLCLFPPSKHRSQRAAQLWRKKKKNLI